MKWWIIYGVCVIISFVVCILHDRKSEDITLKYLFIYALVSIPLPIIVLIMFYISENFNKVIIPKQKTKEVLSLEQEVEKYKQQVEELNKLYEGLKK